MKFIINQAELQTALSIVQKGMSSRSTLPILSGIYIQAVKDRVIFQTTDLDLSIKYSMNALVEEDGETVVSGKLFSEIVKNLPDSSVVTESVEDGVVVNCENTSYSLKTLPPQDFPAFPSVEVDQTVKLPFKTFSSMVKRIVRIVSKDESRAILTGILITVDEDILKMAATDSYRLATVESDVRDYGNEPFEAVIKGSFLYDIATLPKNADYITLSLSENQIVCSYGDTVFINRRIEGNYPNYKQLLPETYVTKTEVEVEKLLSAVKRVSLLSAFSNPIKFDIQVDSQTIQLSSTEQDIGSAQEVIPCKVEGEDVQIAFNYTYILEGITSISTDMVRLETQSSMKPGVFRVEKEDNYLYLVMPVRIS